MTFSFNNITKKANCGILTNATLFNVEIKNFLQEEKINFEQLFLEGNENILGKLFQNSVVVSYLARTSDYINFENNTIPILESSYEKNLYLELSKLMDKYVQDIPLIPVKMSRKILEKNNKEILNEELSSYPLKGYYDNGISRIAIQFIIDELKIQSNNSSVFLVTDPNITEDIYRISAFIFHLKHFDTDHPFYDGWGCGDKCNMAERNLLVEQNKHHQVKFVLSANFKDYHATVIFTVLDDNQKPILSSLINSWINEDDSYHQYSKFRFDMVMTGVQYDHDYPKIPFLETSYNLQSSSEDKNCVIYTLNNIEAIINMLQDQDLASDLVELAKAEDISAFQEKFLDGLRHNLPQYFNCNSGECVASKDEDRTIYHANTRWDFGASFIKEYVCAEKIGQDSEMKSNDGEL